MQPLTGKPNPHEAIRLLGDFTRGRFDLWMLAGRHHAGNRAILLSHLTGLRQPQSKAGVNALRDAYYSTLGIIGETLAEREENFRFVCSETAAALKFESQQPVKSKAALLSKEEAAAIRKQSTGGAQ